MTDTKIRTGFFPVVAADHVTVEQAYAAAVLCAEDVSFNQAGASVVATAGSASITEGGCMALAAAGNVAIDRGGAGMVVARDVTVRNGFVGLALGRRVSLEDSRILLGTTQAAAAAAALAGVLLIGRILVRKR